MAKHGISCPCQTCYYKFEAKGMKWDGDKHRYVKSGSRSNRSGTMRSTNFESRPQRNDPRVTNHHFNSGKVDGSNHGHVKERRNEDGTTSYPYVRDVEGTEYGN